MVRMICVAATAWARRRRRRRGHGVRAKLDGVGTAAALGETRLCCPVFGARLPKARESWGAQLRRSAAARAGVASRRGAVGTPRSAIFRSFFGRSVARGEPGGRGEPGSYLLSYPRALWLARVGVGSADLSQRAKPACSALCSSSSLKTPFAHLLTCSRLQNSITACSRGGTAPLCTEKAAHDLWAACGLPHTPPQRSRFT